MSQKAHPLFRGSYALRLQLGTPLTQTRQLLPERCFCRLIGCAARVQLLHLCFYAPGFHTELAYAFEDFFFAVGENCILFMASIDFSAAIPVTISRLAAPTIVKAYNRKIKPKLH